METSATLTGKLRKKLNPGRERLDEFNHVADMGDPDSSSVSSIRKKMIPIAALKMKWVIEQMNIQQVYVSPYSLKEGVFMSSAS